MTDLYLIFQFVKGCCLGCNQIMLPNEGKLILCGFFAHSHGFVLLLLAREQHCGAERAIR